MIVITNHENKDMLKNSNFKEFQVWIKSSKNYLFTAQSWNEYYEKRKNFECVAFSITNPYQDLFSGKKEIHCLKQETIISEDGKRA